MTVTRGKVHENLDMTVDFSINKGVTITQYDFIKNLWLDLPPDLMDSRRINPSPDFIFKLDKDAPLLNSDRKYKHHKTSAFFCRLSSVRHLTCKC